MKEGIENLQKLLQSTSGKLISAIEKSNEAQEKIATLLNTDIETSSRIRKLEEEKAKLEVMKLKRKLGLLD